MTDTTFRTEPVEYVTGPDGRMIGVQVCEEYDAESGRWEPFVSLVKIVSDER